MTNMVVTVDDKTGEMTIKVNLKESHGPSASGKTTIITKVAAMDNRLWGVVDSRFGSDSGPFRTADIQAFADENKIEIIIRENEIIDLDNSEGGGVVATLVQG